MLYSISLYTLAACNPPRSVVKVIEKLIVSFLWGHADGKDKMVWASWKTMARLTTKGGMDLRDIMEIIEAFPVKLW